MTIHIKAVNGKASKQVSYLVYKTKLLIRKESMTQLSNYIRIPKLVMSLHSQY